VDKRFRQSGETQAYDMGRFQRVVGGDSDRITGTWRTLKSDRAEALIWPLDVIIWDSPSHNSGITFGMRDFSATVSDDGEVDISDYSLSDNKKADLRSVMDELVPLLVTVAQAAHYETEQAEYAWGVTTSADSPPPDTPTH
jgi:hypothetical protein